MKDLSETIEKQYKDKNWLYQKYVIENKSIREITKEANLTSKSTIIYWLEKCLINSKNLIEYKKSLNPKITHTAESLYRDHVINRKSIKEIAKQSNVTSSTILRWITNFKIPLRPYQEDFCNNLVGQRFGLLTVVRPIYSKQNKYKKRTRTWLCKCDCGSEIKLSCNQISTGWVSCGCARRKLGCNEIRGQYFSSLIKGAKLRNLEFDITIEQIWDLFLRQGRKCALSGIELFFNNYVVGKENTASLDRIDNSKGYIIDNIQWIHKDLNFMKQDFKESDFFNWIKTIYEYKNL
jgi:transposase